MRRTASPAAPGSGQADRVDDRPTSHRRRWPVYACVILAAMAAVLAALMLTSGRTRTGPLSRFDWLSIALVCVAIASATLIAIRTRRPGARGTAKTPAGSARASRFLGLDRVSSVVSIIASLLSIVATLIALTPADATVPAHAQALPTTRQPSAHPPDPCAMLLGGPVHLATLSSSGYQGNAQLSNVSYSIYSNDSDAATAQLHSAMYGRLNGHLPAGYVLYVVGHWDPKSISITTHVHGYPHYYPRGEIRLQPDGCWSLSSRNVGEPGSVGLSERILFMLASPAVASVFEQAEEKLDHGSGTGLTQDQMNALNVETMDFFQLFTVDYDRVPS